MKQIFIAVSLLLFGIFQASAQTAPQLYLDVHRLSSVKFKDVAAAHAKDLAVQDKYGVQFLKYWVDEKKGLVYCLASASDAADVIRTHKAAHGLLPEEIHPVTDGEAAPSRKGKTYFLDIHNLGAGKVTAADVASAHQKDLAVQDRFGVRFLNYWVDEQKGVVYCLSQASNSAKVVQTHRAAHGLLPDSIEPVKQGQ